MALSIDAKVIAASNLTVADYSNRKTTDKGNTPHQAGVIVAFRAYFDYLNQLEVEDQTDT